MAKDLILDEIKSEMFIPATSGQAPVFLERYGERVTKKSIFTLTGKLDSLANLLIEEETITADQFSEIVDQV